MKWFLDIVVVYEIKCYIGMINGDWICGIVWCLLYSDGRVERLVILCNYVGGKLVMFDVLCIWVLWKGGKCYYNVVSGDWSFLMLLKEGGDFENVNVDGMKCFWFKVNVY